jgi:putative sigma-54 modulation protein
MRVDIHGHEIKVTAALRDYVEDKFERLSRHFDQPFEVRTQLSLDKPNHCAEATIAVSGQNFHADASAPDMYAAIDLLVDKLDRLLLKHKQKMVDHYRRGESIARSGEFG